jgi:hypothetical protein
MPLMKISLERVRRAELEVQNMAMAALWNFGWLVLAGGMPLLEAARFSAGLVI